MTATVRVTFRCGEPGCPWEPQVDSELETITGTARIIPAVPEGWFGREIEKVPRTSIGRLEHRCPRHPPPRDQFWKRRVAGRWELRRDHLGAEILEIDESEIDAAGASQDAVESGYQEQIAEDAGRVASVEDAPLGRALELSLASVATLITRIDALEQRVARLEVPLPTPVAPTGTGSAAQGDGGCLGPNPARGGEGFVVAEPFRCPVDYAGGLVNTADVGLFAWEAIAAWHDSGVPGLVQVSDYARLRTAVEGAILRTLEKAGHAVTRLHGRWREHVLKEVARADRAEGEVAVLQRQHEVMVADYADAEADRAGLVAVIDSLLEASRTTARCLLCGRRIDHHLRIDHHSTCPVPAAEEARRGL